MGLFTKKMRLPKTPCLAHASIVKFIKNDKITDSHMV